MASVRDLLGVDAKVCCTVSYYWMVSVHQRSLSTNENRFCSVHDWLNLSDTVSLKK